MKKINAFIMLLAIMIGMGSTFAQTTIFTETMGTVGGTTAISAHETANGFDNDSYTMSGTADLRTSTSSSGYTGASGGANVFITALVGKDFMIEGINTSGYTNLTLSLGHNKSTTTGNNELKIEISSDGTSWTQLTYTRPTGSGTATWILITPSGTIPATANLRIRFTQTITTTQFRIDDIKLVGTISATPTLSVSPLADFGTQCIGGTYGPNSFTITGSNLTTANVTVAALSGFTYSTTSGGVYNPSLSIAPSSGSISQEVFVKFSPVVAQSYNGNIAIGGGGVSSSIDRSVTGSGTGAITAVVSSQAASTIGNTTATLNANLTTLGTCPNTSEKGFVYSLTSANNNPLVGGTGVTKNTVAGLTTGAYSLALIGLTSNTGYSYKAYVYDGSTYIYGNVLTFTTKSPATKLAFGTTPPATGIINTNLSSFTLEAHRPDNSIDTEFSGNIILSKASGSGLISGTLTVAAVNGVATFNDIKFNATSTYTITASSGVLTNTTSGNIIINSAPAVIAAWDFTGVGSTSLPTYPATTFNTNLVSTSNANTITRGAGAVWSNANNSFRTAGFKNEGISTANTDYLQITLAPSVGYTMSIATIDANFNGTASFFATPGVTSQFAYSTDGSTFTLIGSPVQSTSLTMTQLNLSGVSALQNIASGTTVTLRYYASGQTTTGGWGFQSAATAGTNGLAIGGFIQVGAVSPAISVSETSLNNFAYIFGNGPSAQQSFIVTGSDLTHNVSIAPPANYEISTVSGAGFTPTNPIEITPILGSVTQNIYVRLKTGLAVSQYNTQTIQVTSSGASDKTVTLSGDVFGAAPTTQATNIIFTTIGSRSIDLSWTSGNGEKRIVKVNTSNSFTDPVDGTNYLANTVYGSGEQIVYNDNGNSVIVSELSPATTYWFRVYEYNNTGTYTKYNVTIATNNPLSKPTLDAPWEDFEIGSKGSYTAGNVTCSAGNWYMSDALIGTSPDDPKNGTQSVRLRNAGYIQTNFDITGGIGTVSVSTARYGSDAIASWLLKVSDDGGATWTAFISDTIVSSTTTLQTKVFTVNIPGNVRIRLEKIIGGNRINWDDIYITHYTALAHQWTGSSSTDWNTVGNWNPATIPNITKDAVIPNVANKPIVGSGTNALAKNITIENGSTLTINQGGTLTIAQELTNNGTLTIKSNASGDGSLITNTTAGSGSYKIERYLSSGKWHLTSSPITNAVSGVFTDIWLRLYNETTNAFGEYISATSIPLNVGQGYSIWTNSSETRTYTGMINNGTVGPIALPKTSDGWNLIGNPYPSAIDVDAASGWSKTNVGRAIYTWDNNQYKVYLSITGNEQGISANGGSRYIASGQGFFVQAITSGSSISMNNNVRVHNTTPFLKNEDAANIIRVKVANENFSDETVFVIRQESMDDFDPMFDASKLRGSIVAPQLYSKKGTEEMTISTFNNMDKLFNRNIYFEPAELTEHVIIYSHTLDGTQIPVLYDKVSQTFIYPNIPYIFTPTESDMVDRFEFKEPITSGVTENNLSQIMVWQSNKKLYVQNLDNEVIKEIKLYDIQGRLVFTGNQNVSDLSHLTSSTYIVKIITDRQNIIKKIIVQ